MGAGESIGKVVALLTGTTQYGFSDTGWLASTKGDQADLRKKSD